MNKNSKNKEQFFDILNHMDAIGDFVDLIGEMCASIDIKFGKKKQLEVPLNASALLRDIVTKYNNVTRIHYIDSYKGVVKSTKKRDKKTYMHRFKKKLYKAVDFRYSCGHAVSTLEKQEVIDALNTFFDLLD